MTELKVVTWNILAPIYVECDYYSIKCEKLDIDLRRKDIFKTIDNMNADVLLLQEVTRSEFAKLVDRYRSKYIMKLVIHDKQHWLVKGNKKKQQRNGNALLIKRGVAEIVKLYGVLLSDTGNRGLVAVIHVNNADVIVCSVHLDDVSGKRRMDQTRALLSFISTISDANTPILIGGDFNEPTRVIVEYMKSFSSVPSNTPTYFEESDMVLDYLFAKNMKFASSHVPKSDKIKIIKEFGSDHLPVQATVIIDKK